MVVIEGPAGIGKTSLLAEARRRATEQEMSVLSAQGAVLERDFGFGIVRQLFEAPLAAAPTTRRRRWLGGAAGLAAPVVSPDHDVADGPALQQSAIVHGVYWLPALDHEGPVADMDLAGWRAANRVRVKQLHATMRARYDAAFLVTATRMGGRHGYDEQGAHAPLGGAVTAAGGVVLSTFLTMDASIGVVFTMKALIIVIMGGVGDVRGAIIASLILGLAETAVASLIDPGLTLAAAYLLFVLVLLFRPEGLFGRRQS